MAATTRFLTQLSVAITLSLLPSAATALVTLDSPPLLDSPVFSIATLDPYDNTNMNILTYAAPVGIRPVRKWAISLYRGTETHANFLRRKRGVLQLLDPCHAELVYSLGGRSSRDVSKEALCRDVGFGWESVAGLPEKVLPRCVGYLDLVQDGHLTNAGEHDVAICRVEQILGRGDAGKGEGDTEERAHLGTKELRSMGIISDAGRAVPPAGD